MAAKATVKTAAMDSLLSNLVVVLVPSLPFVLFLLWFNGFDWRTFRIFEWLVSDGFNVVTVEAEDEAEAVSLAMQIPGLDLDKGWTAQSIPKRN